MRTLTLRASLLALLCLLLPLSSYAITLPAAIYGKGGRLNLPVTMSDGTVIRADVWYPATASGQPAPGPFPVLLQQTPYGKEVVAAAPKVGLEGLAATDVATLVGQGYIVVISDLRGTGQSGGTFSLLQPLEATDGASVVNWAATLPNSTGQVGLFGLSYMGLDEYFTVGALPAHSPVKAMFPMFAGNDIYKELMTQGGVLDAAFDFPIGLPVIPTLGILTPAYGSLIDLLLNGGSPAEVQQAVANLLPTEYQHVQSVTGFVLPTVFNAELGGDRAYDEAFWQTRSPLTQLPKIVQNDVPVFMVGGWSDLFQRGVLLNYTSLQNLAAGRSQYAPMLPGQPTDPRFQALYGPWTHLTIDAKLMTSLQLQWFDTWLKGKNTPLRNTTTPLHLYQTRSGRWIDTATWPVQNGQATKYYLGGGRSGSDSLSPNDGSLGTSAPAALMGADAMLWTGLSNACDKQTTQWTAGGPQLITQLLGVQNACANNDILLGTGPGALTYTTPAFTQDQVLAGPIDATIYMNSTTMDTELVATLEEVTPQGVSVPLSNGALLGSLRAIDSARSWTAPNGAPIKPDHDYTQAAQQPVVPGVLTRYDIEVNPVFAQVPKGWRVRLTLTSSDTPHLIPTLAQLPTLVGGVYAVNRNVFGPSFVNLPLFAPSAFSTACGICQ